MVLMNSWHIRYHLGDELVVADEKSTRTGIDRLVTTIGTCATRTQSLKWVFLFLSLSTICLVSKARVVAGDAHEHEKKI